MEAATPEKEEPDADVEPDPKEKWFKQRRGFTNFHFNRMGRDRIWKACQAANGNFSDSNSRWRLIGVNEQKKKVQMVLADEKSGLEIGSKTWVLDSDSELSDQIVPENTGGLLIALHLWRNFLLQGPEKFGDVYYFGSAPLESDGPTYQILVATSGTVESNFFFHPDTGKLSAIEIYPELNSDPCLLKLKDYRSDGDLSVPATFEYSSGFNTGRLEIETLEFLK